MELTAPMVLCANSGVCTTMLTTCSMDGLSQNVDTQSSAATTTNNTTSWLLATSSPVLAPEVLEPISTSPSSPTAGMSRAADLGIVGVHATGMSPRLEDVFRATPAMAVKLIVDNNLQTSTSTGCSSICFDGDLEVLAPVLRPMPWPSFECHSESAYLHAALGSFCYVFCPTGEACSWQYEHIQQGRPPDRASSWECMLGRSFPRGRTLMVIFHLWPSSTNLGRFGPVGLHDSTGCIEDLVNYWEFTNFGRIGAHEWIHSRNKGTNFGATDAVTRFLKFYVVAWSGGQLLICKDFSETTLATTKSECTDGQLAEFMLYEIEQELAVHGKEWIILSFVFHLHAGISRWASYGVNFGETENQANVEKHAAASLVGALSLKQQVELQYYQNCAINSLHLHRMVPRKVRATCLLVDKNLEAASVCINCEDHGWCFLSSLLSDWLKYGNRVTQLKKYWDPGGLGLQFSFRYMTILQGHWCLGILHNLWIPPCLNGKRYLQPVNSAGIPGQQSSRLLQSMGSRKCVQNELLLLQPWPLSLQADVKNEAIQEENLLEFMVTLVELQPWVSWKCFSLQEHFSLLNFITILLGVTSPWDPGVHKNSATIHMGWLEPGAYKRVSVEPKIHHLVVNSLLKSSQVDEMEGRSIGSFENDISPGPNATKTDFNDTSLSRPASQVLKQLIQRCISDAVSSANVFADAIQQHLYRWVCSPRSRLHDPALHRLLHNVIKKVFALLLAEFRKLGANVIFANFSKIIIDTGKMDLPSARAYCDSLLMTLHTRDLFEWIELEPMHYWHSLLFMDQYNYGGIQAKTQNVTSADSSDGDNDIDIVSSWNIAEYLPTATQDHFVLIVSEFLYIPWKYMKEQVACRAVVRDDTSCTPSITIRAAENLEARVIDYLHGQISIYFAEKLLTIVSNILLHFKGKRKLESVEPSNREVDPHSHKGDGALEFIKHICAVLALDQNVQHDILGMRKNLLKLVRVKEFAPEAQFQDPCASFTLPNVICSYCKDCQDLDLCRDSTLQGHEWRCAVPHCGQPYHHDYTNTEEHQVPWDPGGNTSASAWGQAEF